MGIIIFAIENNCFVFVTCFISQTKHGPDFISDEELC